MQSPTRLTFTYVLSGSRSMCPVVTLSTLFLNEFVWLFGYSGGGVMELRYILLVKVTCFEGMFKSILDLG